MPKRRSIENKLGILEKCLDRTYKDVGEEYGISHSRIMQLCWQAMTRIFKGGQIEDNKIYWDFVEGGIRVARKHKDHVRREILSYRALGQSSG